MSTTGLNVPVLVAENVSKMFGAVAALRNASLQVNRGEIVALMGANGAGKSTFVKILTGALRADTGHVRINGKDTKVASPAQARRSGLIPVYQEPSLIPDLSIFDNMRLTDTPIEDFRHWVNELGIANVGLEDTIKQLPLATLRIIDLARALAGQPDVLLLDEMTAALPNDLVARVLTVIRQQADAGRAIVYISHRFTELAAVCDRASILRDGVTVGDLEVVPGIEERAVELMLGYVGKPSGGRLGNTAARKDLSEVPRLRATGLKAVRRLHDVSFDLYRGDVLGVVALEGQGQDELFDILAGEVSPLAGGIEVNGKAFSFGHPADAIAAGLTFVPGDRAHALLMARSVRENVALPELAPFSHWGATPMAKEAARVSAAVERLQIDTRAQGEVRHLSGGNQQKVTIARWIAHGVETLLLFDPTRGIDIRTKRQIYQLVRELAAGGAAILYYTSELNEVPLACDRVMVMFNGRTVNLMAASTADEPTLLRAAYGLVEDRRAS